MEETSLRKRALHLAGEGLAIFVAVTASLYANEWRDHRNDVQQERQALQLISADLVRDSALVADVAEVFKDNERASAWLSEHWARSSVDADSLGRTVQTYLTGGFYWPQDAAFTSLRDGGGLDLIEDASLRTAIIQYYSVSQAQLVNMVSIHMSAVLQLLDLLGTHFLLFRGASPGSMWPPAPTPPVSLSTWPELRHDSRLYNKATFVGGVAASGLEIARRNLKENRAVRDSIRAYLGR